MKPPGNNDVIVLSHRFWQRRFGGDPDIVGRTVTANHRSFTVVGVMKPDFSYQGARYQFWMPMPMRGANPDKLPVNRNARYVQVLAKLNPGVSRDTGCGGTPVGRRVARAGIPRHGQEHLVHPLVPHRRDGGRRS